MKRQPKAPLVDPETFVLPHSLEAERCALGAALLSESAADHLTDHIQPEAFFRRAHRAIFEAMIELRQRSAAVDLVTIREALGRVGKLDECGGPAYITSLVDGLPRSSNVAHYADLLKDLHLRRRLAQFAHETINRVAAGQGTAEVLLADADQRFLELQGGHVNGRLVGMRERVPGLFAGMEWRHAHRGEVTGVPTGFTSIDELTSGWQAGDLIVIGARPSIGKTSCALNMAVAAGLSRRRDGVSRQVAIFSLEMSREQLEWRLLSSLSHVPLSRILGGYMMEADFTAASTALSTLAELRIAIDDRSGQTAPEIRSACRHLRATDGLDLVVVDYVQLMSGTLDRHGTTRNEQIADISRGLKKMAGELKVPVLLVSQLSRASGKREDATPQLSDLRDSGGLEENADIVVFLHRQHHRDGGVTKCIIDKQRNGPTGSVKLTFDRDTVTFTDGGEEPAEEPRPQPTKQVRSPSTKRVLPYEE